MSERNIFIQRKTLVLKNLHQARFLYIKPCFFLIYYLIKYFYVHIQIFLLYALNFLNSGCLFAVDELGAFLYS